MWFIKSLLFIAIFKNLYSSYEQHRVPHAASERWESYVFNEKEYIIHNLPVNWENAEILCRGYYNGSLAVLDSRAKAEFMAEALAEVQFTIEAVWVGARRDSAEDPEGYRWDQGVELRRTATDVLNSEDDSRLHYPSWLNRTHIPVPEGGADCVGLERIKHDKPVFVDLPCHLERAFVCEREAKIEVRVSELKSVKCRTGLYRIFSGRLDWHQAAAYCLIHKMALANIASMKCLKKLGLTMLKSRPSIESAWVGARGTLGQWTWLDTGVSIFSPSPFKEEMDMWPPMRDRSMKQNGCLQIDRHTSRSPVFLEARCERKMQFICYQAGTSISRSGLTPPSDDSYYYILVRQLYFWQQAYENCQKMNGTLASIENNDILIQLLLVMGENKDEPIEHIWVSGKLNMTKDITTDTITYVWTNPASGRRIADPKMGPDSGFYMAPWLNEEFTMDSPCMNLDRQDHLSGLVYGLPCDTPQYSVCMIEKSSPTQKTETATEGEQ